MRNSFPHLTPRNVGSFLLCTLFVVSLFAAERSASSNTSASVAPPESISSNELVTVHAAGRGARFLKMEDGREAITSYTGDAAPVGTLMSGSARPLSLAEGDFNLDGAPDLLIGYADQSGGIVTLRRGNVDAFAPNDEAVFQAMQRGHTPPAFLQTTQAVAVPEQPDFLLAGDFNQDGFRDALIAKRGGGLYLLAGDGAGNLKKPERVDVRGTVTAVGASDFVRGHGLLSVGINDNEGAAVLLFDAANGLQREAASYAFDNKVSSLAVGQLDRDFYADVAVATGNGVAVIHGSNNQQKNTVAQARVERINMTFSPRSLALGEFVWNRDSRNSIALLADDGTMHLLKPSDLDTRPFTPDELRERSRDRMELATADRADKAAEEIGEWQPARVAGWEAEAQLGFSTTAVDATRSQAPLMSAVLTYHETNDLLVLNQSRGQLDIIPSVVEQLQSGKDAQTLNLPDDERVVALDTVGTPVAVLPMPRKANGERDLVLLSTGSSQAQIVPLVPTATIDVDRTDDNAGASACTAAANDCSLRGAITYANTHAAGTTINLNAISGNPTTYQLTIAGSAEDANATGDLDLTTSGTTLLGAGASSVIIQQTIADRIIGLNTTFASNWTVTISGLKITGGSLPSASGGAISCGAPSNVITIDSCVFDNNKTTANVIANGGAIVQAANVAGADIGKVDVKNTTFSNNSASVGVGGAYAFRTFPSGQGVFTNCKFTGNQALTNSGGAISFNATATAATLTVTGSTFTGNIAGGGNGGSVGGAIAKSNGTVNVNFNRITGNQATAPGTTSGSGFVSTANDTSDVTKNWWGCNGDPAANASGCDTVAKTPNTTGTIISNPRLQFALTTSTSPITYGATTNFVGNLLTDSNGGAVAGSNLGAFNGVALTFSSPVRGTIPNTTFNATGTATGVFTSNAAGAGSATGQLDNQTASTNVTINKGNVTLSAFSTSQNPTLTGQNTTLSITISANSPSPATEAGSLQFQDASNGNALLGTSQTVSGNGTPSTSASFSSTGGHNIIAVFTDTSGNFNNSTTGTLVTQNVTSTATWNGNSSTNWNTNGNWGTNQAPNSTHDVNIPAGALTNEPSILTGGTDVTIKSLTIGTGHTLTVQSPRVLAATANSTITGTLTGTGTFNFQGLTLTNNGTPSITLTNFNGSAAQTLNGSPVAGFGGLTLNNASGLTLGTSQTVNGALTLTSGALAVGTQTLTLKGGVSAASGSLTTSNTGTVNYQGSSAQNALGMTYGNLIINNPAGVILLGNATVNTLLTLTSGDLNTSTFTLTMPAAATSGPATNATDVVGNVKRTGFISGGGANTLSFGNPNNRITINSGTVPTDITVNLAKSVPTGPIGYPNAVQRTYTITPTGGSGISATLRLHYLDSELNGNTEGAGLNLWRFNGTGWVPQTITSFDTTANWVEKTGVTQFSPWTMNSTNSPTVSPVSLSGRVTDADGSPLGGVLVQLSGPRSARTITDAGGDYRFDGLEANNFYVVTPQLANFSFSPTERTVSLIGNNSDASFSAIADTLQRANPLDTDMYYVRQQYLDFLGREPDEGGLQYWTAQISSCRGDAQCEHESRIGVSAAFFIEQEYQQTGSFVYRLYNGALGRQLTYAEFNADRSKVLGGENLDQSKEALAKEFAQRPEFLAKYVSATSADSFVSALIETINLSAGVDISGQREALVAKYNTGTSTVESRSLALMDAIEVSTFKQATYNPSFVLMQYFGYLKRDADQGGYDFWLNVLNNAEPNNYRGMVCSFITSTEYQKRFSSVATRSNAECK